MSHADDDDDSEHWRNASDSLLDGISGTKSAIVYTKRGVLTWADEHPMLSKIIGIPVSTLGAAASLSLLGMLYSFFYGQTVPISDDVMLGTLPLPVGLSIYLLFSLWLLTSYLAYIHIVTLRQRIEELENS